MKTKGVLLTLLSALLYGFTPVLCSLTYGYGNTPMTLLFFRSFFVLPILLVIMKKEHLSIICETYELQHILLVAIFGTTLTTLLLYSSYQYIGVGTATTLHFLYPIFVALICHFVFKDVLNKKMLVALAISFFGVFMFIDIKDFTKIQGILMALTSGLTFSFYLVGIEKFRLAKMNNYVLSFYLSFFCCISVFVVGFMTQQLVFDQPFISFLLMFVVAILAQLVAGICLKVGIEYLGSSLASLLSLVEPVSSVMFGALLLQEEITMMKILGCLLIMFAISLLVKK